MSALYLDSKESIVLVIDLQGRLFSAMPELAGGDMVRSATVLLEASVLLGVPAIATEQVPDKLGGTLDPVVEKLQAASAPRISKADFSACGEPAFNSALEQTGRRKAIVVGMETHICVFQTVRDLCARGLSVHVPINGVASRRDDHRATGLDLCRAAGATITTTETVLFDWLGRAGSDEFRKISRLIK
jgi:nicotinamidase-related amidase